MARDLSTVSTAELRSEYEPKAEKLRELRAAAKALDAEIAPLRDELAAREHKYTLILNAVMAGQQQLLRATGTPEEVIAEAEADFAARKAAREAARAARAEVLQ